MCLWRRSALTRLQLRFCQNWSGKQTSIKEQTIATSGFRFGTTWLAPDVRKTPDRCRGLPTLETCRIFVGNEITQSWLDFQLYEVGLTFSTYISSNMDVWQCWCPAGLFVEWKSCVSYCILMNFTHAVPPNAYAQHIVIPSKMYPSRHPRVLLGAGEHSESMQLIFLSLQFFRRYWGEPSWQPWQRVSSFNVKCSIYKTLHLFSNSNWAQIFSWGRALRRCEEHWTAPRPGSATMIYTGSS